MANILSFSPVTSRSGRKPRIQHFHPAPAKSIACPHGCGATFAEYWHVDEHLRAKHPGYMQSVANMIASVAPE